MKPIPIRPGKISDIFEARVGAQARCPHCGNENDFTAFLNSEIVSAQISKAVGARKNWRVEQPNLGRMTLKDVRCGQCGYRDTPSKFSIATERAPNDKK